MSPAGPLAKTQVGVVMERRKAKSQWIDFVWRPASVLPGVPDTPPWTQLESRDEITLFYAGNAEIGLYRSDTPQYRDNLATGAPGLWIVARPTGGEPPFAIVTVTANPSEGEAFTESGNDLVEQVAMPDSVREMLEAFVAEHHVEQPFYKRKRQRGDPEALARRGPVKDHKS